MRRTAGLLLMLAAGCWRSPEVVRVVDGEEHRGRFVTVRAYSAYARGAYLESQRDYAGANVAYEEALATDPSSQELWTRLAAVRCRRNQPSADAAFARAAGLDDDYEPLARERARCAAHRGDLAAALRHAEHAVRLDPERVESTLLLVDLYDRAGRAEDGERWLLALVSRHPASTAAWRATLRRAETKNQSRLAARARTELERLGVRLQTAESNALATLDGALMAGDLAKARILARRIGVGRGVLALRAAALGRTAEARAQAALVLGADPEDPDARVAALVAADLSGDAARLEETLKIPLSDPTEPSSLAVRLLAELIGRRIGQDARDRWLAAAGPIGPPEDGLEERVASRLAQSAADPNATSGYSPAPWPTSH